MREAFAIIFLALFAVLPAKASDRCNNKYNNNYAERKAYILNFAPGLQITGFNFCNTKTVTSYSVSDEFIQNLSWKNVGNVPVVSYEVDTILFDPFNRELIGSRMIVPGTDSAHWEPLAPGKAGADGMIRHESEDVYTAIGYISAVRYANGTVWTIDRASLATAVKGVVATFEDKDAKSNTQASNSPPNASSELPAPR
jgi:hypothetical protein